MKHTCNFLRQIWVNFQERETFEFREAFSSTVLYHKNGNVGCDALSQYTRMFATYTVRPSIFYTYLLIRIAHIKYQKKNGD